MSYRESRVFVDSLRSLGFKEPSLSESSFYTPNFELLSDILDFLCSLLDPRSQLPEEIATENDRVVFIKKALSCIVARTGIKLNAKLLYQADAFAVKEILKTLSFLNASVTSAITTTTTSNVVTTNPTTLLESSGHLFRLLLEKPAFCLPDQVTDFSSLAAIDEEQLAAAEQVLAELNSHDVRLTSLVQKRRAELERTARRLASIKTVRPAFLDEYRKLETELAEVYSAYVEKFKILDFAEHQLDLFNLEEVKKLEAREAAVALANKKLRDDEWRAMRGESSTTATRNSAKPVVHDFPVVASADDSEEEGVSIDEDDGESNKDENVDADLYEVEEDNDDF